MVSYDSVLIRLKCFCICDSMDGLATEQERQNVSLKV